MNELFISSFCGRVIYRNIIYEHYDMYDEGLKDSYSYMYDLLDRPDYYKC